MIGLDFSYSTATGAGVTVAVLDTGIDLDHPDFRGRFIEGADAVSFVEGEDVRDLNGHGTHCAGVIAGPVSPACGTRYGVAPQVKLLVGKVLRGTEGEGYDSDILDGIDWAADQGAQIVSMSLGAPRNPGAPYNTVYERVAAHFLRGAQGPLLIAAAGNERLIRF
jgi:subtilisin family serine protease